jgi:predicted transposase/invertase (TIGR01784 family)
MGTTTHHDTGYKLLFSHPEMVRDLLTGYMPGGWLEQADFTTLERVNASYVSENERQRHDDMVWRLKVGPQWVWVYLLLEFQSEPDAWMALRLMVYVGLLAQHLVREGELCDGLLPPVVPIVLYNGATPWKVATDVADCFGPSLPGLEPYRPHLLYHLVDEARLKLHPMREVRNLAEALFRLERGRTPQDIYAVLLALGVLLQGAEMQTLRRTLTVWVRMLLRRKAPRANAAELDDIKDLLEADTMLEQTIERWFDEAERKGLERGMQRGMQEGRQEGMQQGMQQGREEGVQQGMRQGLQQGLVKAVALQLQLRFGPMPGWVQGRLDSATEEQLVLWTAAILTATSLQDLFGLEAGQA